MDDAPGSGPFEKPADAYDGFMGRYGGELAYGLIGCAGVAPGARALDVGCGPGALTTALVALLTADQVAAIDPSVSFAEACRARHPDVAVVVAAAEALPFADAVFDHALAQLVVPFMADAPAGVREMRRVTRPGGTVAAAVWDYGGEMVLLRRFWDAAAALDPAAATRDERHLPYCTPQTLQGLWSGAGLADVAVTARVVSAGYDSVADLWQPLEAGVGPAGAYVASLSTGGRAALRREVARRLGVADGPFRLPARAWLVCGRVP